MLTGSMFTELLGNIFPGIVYLSQTLNFVAPVFIDEKVQNLNLFNCHFENFNGYIGGALNVHIVDTLSIKETNFINNTAKVKGGAINIDNIT